MPFGYSKMRFPSVVVLCIYGCWTRRSCGKSKRDNEPMFSRVRGEAAEQRGFNSLEVLFTLGTITLSCPRGAISNVNARGLVS